MAEYQAINARRACLQAAALLCAYAAARYQKLTLPRNQALTLVAAAILLGVSTKVHKPLEERAGVLLGGGLGGLVACGTSKLEPAKSAKYLTVGTMLGTQLMISKTRRNAFLGRVAAIDVKEVGAREEVNVLYEEIVALKGQLTPQDLIRACIALFSKACPFSDDGFFEHSIAFKLLRMHDEAIRHLVGWEKAAAKMHYYELLNEHKVPARDIVISEEGLSPEEMVKRQEWLDTTGLWIRHRWSIWRTTSLKAIEEKFNELKVSIEASDCRLTPGQKLDLHCELCRLAKKRMDRINRMVAERNRMLKNRMLEQERRRIALLENGFKK